MIRNNLRRLAAIGAVTGMLTAGLATAALADTGPVQVSGTVNQSVTLSGLSPSITFPAANPGQTATATGAESYSVLSNDPSGYLLTVTPGGNSMQDSAADQAPNNEISVAETSGSGTSFNFQNSATETIDTTHSAAAKTYTENWAWAIPGNQPAGSYHESFNYSVLGE
jgi:hypothetical protein